MNKKIIIISVIGILIVGLGLIIFLFSSKNTGNSLLKDFLPFGKPSDSAPRNTNSTQNNQGNSSDQNNLLINESQETKGLRQLSSEPVSGATIFVQGSSTSVRYVEKATGHIYEVDLHTSVKKRISNTTIPKIEEVAWGNNGQTLVARFMKEGTLQSRFATIASSSASTTDGLLNLEGFDMAPNILSLMFSPKKDKIFYFTGSRLGAEGFTTNSRGEKASLVWKFPITEWVVEWQQNDTINLTTKSSNNLPGSMYEISLKNGSFTPILSGIAGLSTKINSDGSKILYSESSRQSLELKLLNKISGSTSKIPLATLAEKCSWQNKKIVVCGVPSNLSGNLPDSWYQGKVSFSDTLWRIDTDHLITENLINSSDQESFDIQDIKIGQDEKNIIFTNKKDGSLWVISITPEPVSETSAG